MQCGKGKKSWLMMLGCLLPIIALFTLPLFGIKSVYFSWLAFLICPLMMFFMMKDMNNEKNCETTAITSEQGKETKEENKKEKCH